MQDSIDDIVKKYILINATGHGGTAQPKSVLGKLLADNPELRGRVLELRSLIEQKCRNINNWSIAKQNSELEKFGGYEAPKKVEKKGLPDLERGDKFIVRFAPNPDGALHLGNARPAVLSDVYCRKYKGKLILRFDDTDPKVKVPEKKFYIMIKEDLKWLKVKWHQEITASKRFQLYYFYAEKLIRMSKAYVCTCNIEKWKVLRNKCKSCPCRDAGNQMKKWKKMLAKGPSSYSEGEAVLRIRTDMDAKNPAVRDWPAFRIVDKPMHPFVKKKVWPLYNFASGIDDHLLGVTHIFRGQEHSTNEVKQRFVYQYLGWVYPIVITLGRFSLSDMVLSKSEIREGIKKHIYGGWDDSKLGTIRSLKKRGFQADAIRQIISDVGPKPSDITISMENLAAYNRKIVDKTANRYFFIQNPKKIEVKGLRIKKIKIPLHPDLKRGFRQFSLSKTFYIDVQDFETHKGVEIRLKELCNIKLDNISQYTGMAVKPTPKIQWVPAKHISVRVNTPDREIKGYAETNLIKEKVGNIVQFERFGFVKIDKISKKNVIVTFSHQ